MRLNSIDWVLVFAVLLFAGTAPATGQQRPNFGLEAGLRYDSNIGLASDGDDEIDDYTTRVAATIQYATLQAGTSEVLLAAEVGREICLVLVYNRPKVLRLNINFSQRKIEY